LRRADSGQRGRGAVVEPIREVLKDLPVNIVENTAWQTGQSSSIRAGVTALPSETGSAIFLLCDQPQIPAALLRGLVEIHNQSLAIIISPLVDGKRANPNLFDRDAFQDLLGLQGDVGGRAVFSKYRQYGFPGMTARLLSTWIRLKTIAVYWKRVREWLFNGSPLSRGCFWRRSIAPHGTANDLTLGRPNGDW